MELATPDAYRILKRRHISFYETITWAIAAAFREKYTRYQYLLN